MRPGKEGLSLRLFLTKGAAQILFSHKKKQKEILLFVARWMKLVGVTLREISQTEND